MKKSEEEIKLEIAAKRSADKIKLKTLTKVAIAGVLTRILIYALPFKLDGLLVEILLLPLLLLIFALPFHAFQKLLDKISK